MCVELEGFCNTPVHKDITKMQDIKLLTSTSIT